MFSSLKYLPLQYRLVTPTLKEIAAAAGVHYTTVSLALRNSPRLNAATRARIQQLAKELGYRPNPLVSALMRSRRNRMPAAYQGTISFLIHHSERLVWQSNPFVASIHEGAAAAASAQGYQLSEFWLREDRMSDERASAILVSRGVQALMIPPLIEACEDLNLAWENFATVALGYSLPRPNLHRVATDHYQGMTEALQQCRSRGFRRVGLMLESLINHRVGGRWHAAYLQFHADQSAPHPPPLIIQKWDEQAFLQWVERDRPDAVITLGAMFEQAKALIQKMKWKIGLVNLLVIDPQAGISGIDQVPEQLGRAAAEQLIAMLHRNERGIPASPRTILIPGSWVDGNSLQIGFG
jgi:DNA-binding LacI/PurR family transcriptional regulator